MKHPPEMVKQRQTTPSNPFSPLPNLLAITVRFPRRGRAFSQAASKNPVSLYFSHLALSQIDNVARQWVGFGLTH